MNTQEINQFKADWNELTTDELAEKHKTHRVAIIKKGKELGLKIKGNGWWPQSKIERFKSLYGKIDRQSLLVEFECSCGTISNKKKQLIKTTT